MYVGVICFKTENRPTHDKVCLMKNAASGRDVVCSFQIEAPEPM